MEQVTSNGITYDVLGYRRPLPGEHYLSAKGVAVAQVPCYGPGWWVIKPVKWEPKEEEIFWCVSFHDNVAKSFETNRPTRRSSRNEYGLLVNVYQYKHLADVAATKINSIFQESL
jgi:hypothetical protein